ncbi:DGTP triphosphohydrolase [Spironucleus salmonicida]|uniref:HD domain-containing protein n=1 Tax=Spironucleus salmonicida TaxID=348837 RepID=V6LY94_9EUKA|nr:DGTP triphosphohydrolase [Spironucleus salmonicida]|eukprot:EST45769.1 HD domain-containing protein [Spironucleus salmonicida]
MTLKEVKDPVYNSIQLEDFAYKIIKTPQFQRLRHLRQNGMAYLVYPSANHTRFEHSLGVYHLTKIALDHLNAQLPESLSDRVTKIVKTAALVHDIGHGPFSHLFEQILHKNNIKLDGKQICHESIGCDVFRKMMQRIKMDVGMDDHDIDCVCSLITGQEADDETFKKYFFLNQIVSNSVNGLDTDKMDYLLRDSRSVGLGLTIDPIRILKNQSIFKYPKDSTGKYYLSSSQKTKFDIMQVYHSRYVLNKIIYLNSKILAFNEIVCKIFDASIKSNLLDIGQLYRKDTLPDDRILYYVQLQVEDQNQKYKELCKSFQILNYHMTPDIIFELSITKDCKLTEKVSSQQREQYAKEQLIKISNVDSKLFEVVVADINYGVKNQNPLDFLPIHNKQTVFTPTQFAEQYGNRAQSIARSISSKTSKSLSSQTPAKFTRPVVINNVATQDMLMPNIFKETCFCVFIYPEVQSQIKEQLKSAINKFLNINNMITDEANYLLNAEISFDDPNKNLQARAISPLTSSQELNPLNFKFDEQ